MQCIYFESRAEIDFRSPVKNNFIGFDSDIRIGYGHVSLRLLVSDMVSNLYIFRMVHVLQNPQPVVRHKSWQLLTKPL